MKSLLKTSRDMCTILERILFNAGYWTFWVIWNLLGLKWLFRAVCAVIDKADERDSEKIRRRMRALHNAGEAI